MKNWITILLFLTFSVSISQAKTAEAPTSSGGFDLTSLKQDAISGVKSMFGISTSEDEGALSIAKTMYEKLNNAEKAYADVNTCHQRMNAAGESCLESTSPAIQTAVATVNMILTSIDVVNINNSCSKFAKAMQVAKVGMTTFTVQCSGFKIACQSACAASEKKVVERIKECTASGQSEAFCSELHLGQKTFAIKANSVCGGYDKALATAVASAATAWQRSAMGKACAAQTAAVKPVDCTIAANATNVTCICQKDPRATGCPGAASGSTVSATTPTQITNGGTDGAVADTDGNLQLTRDLGANSKITPGTATSSNSPGTGTGVAVSGDGGASGGVGSSASAKSADGSKGNTKGLNANILSGDFGGGGGGSRGGGSGVEAGASNAYRAFMPGGAKDPSNSRGTASAAAASGVTGAGGADNWQKVRSRYIDTKGTLLGD